MSLKAFVGLVEGKAPPAAALIVRQALASRDVFFYAGLLETPEVQALRGTTDASIFSLLEVFCFGTIKDLAKLPVEAQKLVTGNILLKLKQLSLLSLCARRRSVTYDEIAAALDVADSRELEDIVIDTVTDGLLRGKIDPQRRQVDVTDVAAREVIPGDVKSIDSMIETLRQWKSKCEAQLKSLDLVVRECASDVTVKQATNAAFAAEEQSRLQDTIEFVARDHAAMREADQNSARAHGRASAADRRGFR